MRESRDVHLRRRYAGDGGDFRRILEIVVKQFGVGRRGHEYDPELRVLRDDSSQEQEQQIRIHRTLVNFVQDDVRRVGEDWIGK